jgi:hypothetical protein
VDYKGLKHLAHPEPGINQGSDYLPRTTYVVHADHTT